MRRETEEKKNTHCTQLVTGRYNRKERREKNHTTIEYAVKGTATEKQLKQSTRIWRDEGETK